VNGSMPRVTIGAALRWATLAVPLAAGCATFGAWAAQSGAAVAQTTSPHAAQKTAASPSGAVHKAEGVVRSVGDEVVIKHGPIESMGMGAMTMAFKAPKGGVPKDVKSGTHVKFEFVVMPQGGMQLTSIVPGGSGAK
jgi:Cu/Ag efflux protein CusF